MKKVLFLFTIISILVASTGLTIKKASAQPTLPSCNKCNDVTNLVATNITNTSVDISWQHANPNCGFMIFIYNQTDGTYTSYAIPIGNTHTVTGLNPLSTYSIWVAQIYTPINPDDLPVDCMGEEIIISTKGDGIGCDCDMVFNLQATNITNTTADISWSCNAFCQDFYVIVTDMNTTQSHTYIVLGANNYTITGLNPGALYSIDVAVISNAVPGVCCLGEQIHITTDHSGVACWDCAQPSNVNVQSVTQTSANVTWTTGSLCNDFEIYVYDNRSFSMQVHNVVGSSYTLTGLKPSTPYTIFVAMKSIQIPGISCAGTEANFTTLHCGNFSQSYLQHTQTLHFFDLNSNNSEDMHFFPGNPNSLVPLTSYLFSDNTHIPGNTFPNSSFNFSQGGMYQIGLGNCHHPGIPVGTIYVNIWFDFNNDGFYTMSEKVINYTINSAGNSSSSNACMSFSAPIPGTGPQCNPCVFNAPNQTYTNIRGRCIVSFNDANPCGPISNGQVLDFLVNIQ